MYCLSIFCVVCLNKEEQYRILTLTDSDDAQLLHKLQTCSFVTDFLDINRSLYICNKCMDRLEDACEFRDMCRKNSLVLRGYIAQLSHVSASTNEESGIIVQSEIKQEYVDECETEFNYICSDLTLKFDNLNSINKEKNATREAQEKILSDSRDEYLNIKREILYTDAVVGTTDGQQTVEPANNANEFKCDICNIIFTSLSDLEIHESIHFGECTVCGKQFSFLSHLKMHLLFHGEKKFQCSVCKKKVATPAYLKIHMRLHTGEKKYQCAVCKKRFATSGRLKAHMLYHGEKKYQCSVCEKKIATPSYLKMHMRLHTGEKKYQCAVCKKRFSFRNGLTTHMVIHTREKNHKCTVCKRKFTDRATLKTHLKMHNKTKNFQCTFCEKSFKYYKCLKTHTRIHNEIDI